MVEWDPRKRKFITRVCSSTDSSVHETRHCYNSHPAKTVTKLQGPTLFLGLACCCPCLVSLEPANPLPLAILVYTPLTSASITIILHRASLVYGSLTAEMSTERVTFLDTTKMTYHTRTCIPSQLTPTSTYHPIAVIPNTAPPQSHTARPQTQENLLKKRGSNELRDHLLACGYETNLVDHQIQRAALIPCPQALQPCPRQKQPRCVPLVTTYTDSLA